MLTRPLFGLSPRIPPPSRGISLPPSVLLSDSVHAMQARVQRPYLLDGQPCSEPLTEYSCVKLKRYRLETIRDRR